MITGLLSNFDNNNVFIKKNLFFQNNNQLHKTTMHVSHFPLFNAPNSNAQWGEGGGGEGSI
jgi:hypothetical protein